MDVWFAVFLPVVELDPVAYGEPIVAEVFLTEEECRRFWIDRVNRARLYDGLIMPADKYDGITEIGQSYFQTCTQNLKKALS